MRLIILSLYCAFSHEAFASSFYCNDRIVSSGQTKREVQKLCGAPTFIDERNEEKTVETYRRIKHKIDSTENHKDNSDEKVTSDSNRFNNEHQSFFNLNDYLLVNENSFEVKIEEWTYNFGPERFIRTLTFENGELVDIETGGYGFDEPRGDYPNAEIGDSKAVVFMKYGEPTETNTHQESVSEVHYRDQGNYLYAEKCVKFINIDQWIYDFGPDRLVQKLIFKDNRLVDLDF